MAFKVELVSELELDIGGDIVKITEPNVDQMLEYSKAIKKAEGDDEQMLQVCRDFLKGLGFPDKYHKKMGIKSYMTLISYIGDQKKS
jgi:hypothetical protein